jgi:hypothetical protein
MKKACALIVALTGLSLLAACAQEEVPTVTTAPVITGEGGL